LFRGFVSRGHARRGPQSASERRSRLLPLFASPSPDPSPEKERRVRGQGLIGTAPPPSSCEKERGRLPHFASGSHEDLPNRGKRGLHLPSGGSPRRSMVRSN